MHRRPANHHRARWNYHPGAGWNTLQHIAAHTLQKSLLVPRDLCKNIFSTVSWCINMYHVNVCVHAHAWTLINIHVPWYQLISYNLCVCVFAIVFVMVHPCAHHSTGVVFIRCSEPGVWSTLTWYHHILTLKRSSSYFKQRTPTEGMHLNRMWTYCVSAFSDTPRGCNVGQNVGDCDRRILDSICMGVCVCPSNGLIMGWFARVWWCVMHHANSGLLAISCCLSNVWLCFASAFSRLSHHSHPSNIEDLRLHVWSSVSKHHASRKLCLLSKPPMTNKASQWTVAACCSGLRWNSKTCMASVRDLRLSKENDYMILDE